MRTSLLAVVVSVFLLLSPILAQPYSEVYVFGESLVDMGNFKNLFATIGFDYPPDPPYAGGRFCNGKVFPEVIADNVAVGELFASSDGGSNYAFGAAHSLLDRVFFGLTIPSVRHQVENYLANAGTADPEALYILHDGGNDSFLAMQLLATEGWDVAAAHMQTSAAGIVGSVDLLAANGAVSFVIPGAPLFSLSASYCDNEMIDALGEVYNTELESGLAALGADLSIVYFDLFGFEDSISDHFITGCVSHCLTAEGVCDNPEDFLLWDEVHFSEALHQLIGEAITVALLRDKVLYLTMEGVLNAGNSNALLAKLDGAYSKLEDRQPHTAANKIQAFANQVEAFVQTGKLSAEQAELLLVGASGLVDQP